MKIEVGKLVYVPCISSHNDRYLDMAIVLADIGDYKIKLWSVLDGSRYTMTVFGVYDNEEEAQKSLNV